MPFEDASLDREAFVNGKVSKIKFMLDEYDQSTRFITAFCDSTCNAICSWDIVDKSETPNGSGFFMAGRIETKAGVNDIHIISSSSLVAALADGSLVFAQILENGVLIEKHRTVALHRIGRGQATAVIALGQSANSREMTICCGGDTGRIMSLRADVGLQTFDRIRVFASELTPVNCMARCTSRYFVSGHASGQIHYWDICSARLIYTIEELAVHVPLISKAVASICDGITCIETCPTDPHVIAYGTKSGSVGFLNARTSDTSPNCFLVSKYAIDGLRFNPTYPLHLFSISKEGLLHWDASATSSPKKLQESYRANQPPPSQKPTDLELIFGTQQRQQQPSTSAEVQSPPPKSAPQRARISFSEHSEIKFYDEQEPEQEEEIEMEDLDGDDGLPAHVRGLQRADALRVLVSDAARKPIVAPPQRKPTPVGIPPLQLQQQHRRLAALAAPQQQQRPSSSKASMQGQQQQQGHLHQQSGKQPGAGIPSHILGMGKADALRALIADAAKPRRLSDEIIHEEEDEDGDETSAENPRMYFSNDSADDDDEDENSSGGGTPTGSAARPRRRLRRTLPTTMEGIHFSTPFGTKNPWLARGMPGVRIKQLLEIYPSFQSAVDASRDTIVVGTMTCKIATMENFKPSM